MCVCACVRVFVRARARAWGLLLQYRFLPAPYLSFGGSDCVDTEDPGFKSPLDFNLTYTWTNCVKEAAARRSVRECQCVSGWIKGE